MIKLTRIERISKTVEHCLAQIKEAVDSKDVVILFSTMYYVNGIISMCNLLDMQEVDKMVEDDPISKQFIELCKIENEKESKKL